MKLSYIANMKPVMLTKSYKLVENQIKGLLKKLERKNLNLNSN